MAGSISSLSVLKIAAAQAAQEDGLICTHEIGNGKSELFSSSSHIPIRRGKWTSEEEDYANRLIQEFKDGNLPLQDNTTLRTFLSKVLNCDPMRISKKFVGSNSIGKQIFSRKKYVGPQQSNAERTQILHSELAILEKNFLERVTQNKPNTKVGGRGVGSSCGTHTSRSSTGKRKIRVEYEDEDDEQLHQYQTYQPQPQARNSSARAQRSTAGKNTHKYSDTWVNNSNSNSKSGSSSIQIQNNFNTGNNRSYPPPQLDRVSSLEMLCMDGHDLAGYKNSTNTSYNTIPGVRGSSLLNISELHHSNNNSNNNNNNNSPEPPYSASSTPISKNGGNDFPWSKLEQSSSSPSSSHASSQPPKESIKRASVQDLVSLGLISSPSETCIPRIASHEDIKQVARSTNSVSSRQMSGSGASLARSTSTSLSLSVSETDDCVMSTKTGSSSNISSSNMSSHSNEEKSVDADGRTETETGTRGSRGSSSGGSSNGSTHTNVIQSADVDREGDDDGDVGYEYEERVMGEREAPVSRSKGMANNNNNDNGNNGSVTQKKMELEQQKHVSTGSPHTAAGRVGAGTRINKYDPEQDLNVSSTALNSVNRFMKNSSNGLNNGLNLNGSNGNGSNGHNNGRNNQDPHSKSIENFWLLVESGDIPQPDTNVLCEPLAGNQKN